MGANQGRAKGNKQEAEYEEPGKKTRETGSERTGKAGKRKRKGAPEKPLRGETGKSGKEETEAE